MVTTVPLTELEELWNWNEDSVPHSLVGKPLENYSRRRDYPSTLLCHDMKGGYLSDEKLDGCEVTETSASYIIFHWWYIDIFVYFSHNFITIPPVGWINQAHMHGVIVLGTLITEWDGGAHLCQRFLHDEDCVIKTKEHIKYLDLFLTLLTEKMRQTVGERSRVIWYDSVCVDGKLKWQNELNDQNQRWFDVTDGIFLNYSWKVKQLSESAVRAKCRHKDVFVGVDCFGRGCHGGGGWNCHEAFMHPRQYDLSVALFAPGWIVETMPRQDVIINSLRFWDRLITFVHPHPLTVLPIDTDFNYGYKDDGTCKYYNLAIAKLQPYYLSSGIFPKSGGIYVVLPGPALYRLFVTSLLLNGTYNVRVNCDSKLELMLWKKESCEEKVERVKRKDDEAGNTWTFSAADETVVGIGVLSSDSAVLRNFIFRRLTVTS